jgi:phage gp29-like protein
MAKPKKVSPRVTAERARQALQSRSATILRGLTPERLLRALEEFDMGYLRDAAQLWQKIKDRDDTTLPVSQKRELETALLEYEILQVDDSPEAAKHKQALEAAYNSLVATDALIQDKRGGVSLLIGQMMHAVGHRYAVHEIVWDPSGDDLTAEFRFTPLQFFEATTGRLRFLASEGAATGEDLEAGGWMITVGAGLMEATSIATLFKQLPLKAWLVFCDKAGMPGLHGQTDAQQGSKEWDKFRDAIASFGEDWALITSLAAKITPIDLKQGGQLPHPLLVDRMDRAIARIWRGADLGTMSKDGSAVGANPQDNESEIFAAADAKIVSETLNHYFDRWVIRYRFGVEPLAYFKLKPRVRLNEELQLKIDQSLLGWGVEIGKNDLRERYGRAEPDAGDELATAPSASVFPPTSGALVQPIANEAGAAGRDAIFKAKAQADELAAKRPVYRPIATHLAEMYAAPDAAALLAATQKLQSRAHTLYRGVVAAAPELAKPAQDAIGTALLSGFAEAARARKSALPPKS